MPLPKRFVADAQLYAPPDIYEESPQDNLLRDISSAGNLGALHQISFLSLYAFEMFDNLSRLAEDVGSRIINATERSSRLVDRLTQVESRIQRISTSTTKTPPNESQVIRQKKQTMKFLKVRSAQHIPSALNKMTNSAQVNGLYADCNLPPQFWKLEALTFDDCLIRYSNPGLFFEEWLKVELLKQEENRLERKRLKKERKLAKKKRREEEALAAASGDLDPDQVRRKGLKDKRRKNKAEKKEKAKEEATPTHIPTTTTPAHPQHVSHTTTAPRTSTTSNLFSSAANYGFKMQPPSPSQRPSKPPPQKHGSGKKPTKPPPSKPPPSKPPPNKPPPSRKPPTKPPPSRTPPTKPPPSNKPPTKPPKQVAKSQHQVKPVQKSPVTKPMPTPVQSKPPPTINTIVSNDEGPDDLPPPDDIEDDEDPPPEDESDLPDDLPPPDDDELPDDLPTDINKTVVIEDDEDEPPPDDDELPDDFMEDPPVDEDVDIIEDDNGPPVDDDVPPSDDDEPIIEDEDDIPPTDILPPVKEEESELDEEDEDAFDELPLPVVPVVMQPVAPPPKRKQSILMIGRDKKKMAEEASANLQRLNLAAGEDVKGEFDHVIETFTTEEKMPSHLEALNESDSMENSKSDSVRRKSFLSSNLNLGMDLQAPTENIEVSMTEDDGNEGVEYNNEMTGEMNQEQVEEQEEGGEEYYNYDQTQYEGEQETDNYDEYYQDGYFWNGTEWVVADEVQGENDGTVDGYEENNVEEETPQQSALSLFGGGDMLASIRQGNTLRKVEPPERKVTAREGMLSMIKKGGMTLKKADASTPLGKKPDSKPDQSDAIARLLSNRAQIAGSDSDSSDSDDSDSDDSYF